VIVLKTAPANFTGFAGWVPLGERHVDGISPKPLIADRGVDKDAASGFFNHCIFYPGALQRAVLCDAFSVWLSAIILDQSTTEFACFILWFRSGRNGWSAAPAVRRPHVLRLVL